MLNCFFVSDLHGRVARYELLFRKVEEEMPEIVFIGGDIMPGFSSYSQRNREHKDFLDDYLAPKFQGLKSALRDKYPRVFLILGNDDGRKIEGDVLKFAGSGIWDYIHFQRRTYGDYSIYGYSYIPPTPFRLKDWERYDISRDTPSGCISPESGALTVDIPMQERRNCTIQKDLEKLAGRETQDRAVYLFHSPPYGTNLDLIEVGGGMNENNRGYVNVGSKAIRGFIETVQPLLTLHGHIHESADISGDWRDKIGRTQMFNASHNGPELSVIKFDLSNPIQAVRELL